MGSNNAETVFHVRATGPITLTLLDTLASLIEAWVTSDWKPNAAVDWVATELVLTGLNSLFDPRKSYPISPAVAGADATGAMPANCTIALKEDIGRRGRGVAGRWFWVGLAKGMCSDNLCNSGVVTALLTALNNLANTIASTAGFEGICVPHLVVNHLRPPVATSDVITGFLASDDALDSQKDRLPFHKKHKHFPAV
jgi:hypothetical protein